MMDKKVAKLKSYSIFYLYGKYTIALTVPVDLLRTDVYLEKQLRDMVFVSISLLKEYFFLPK